jgi:hypothetical protein
MSFPSSLILACLSRPMEAALVSVPNDDRAYLTPWWEKTQGQYRSWGRLALHFAELIGDCHFPPSAI